MKTNQYLILNICLPLNEAWLQSRQGAEKNIQKVKSYNLQKKDQGQKICSEKMNSLSRTGKK